jgi:hypothetical protein
MDEDIAVANRAPGRDLDERRPPTWEFVNLGTRAMGGEGIISSPKLGGYDVLLPAGPGSEQSVHARAYPTQYTAGDKACDGSLREAELDQLSAGYEAELTLGDRDEAPQPIFGRELGAHGSIQGQPD